ncbi:MAG: heme exporter protein CcmD [Pseudomonadota bacterium]
MNVDLGRYAVEIALAYGVSLVLIAAIVWLSFAQSRAAKRELEEAETRRRK